MKIDAILDAASVIPVLEADNLDAAAPLAQALSAGGLRVVEMTMRAPKALDIMVGMKKAAPSLVIGMGTIRSGDDARRAAEAGADFLVSPGASDPLLGALSGLSAPSLPGVATASEAMRAQEAGFSALKFFPAEPAGGVSYLKALAGPLPDLRFCPTGGISRERAPAYLALANVACVGGSWVASKSMIAAGDWSAIEENARIAATLGD
ncbi:MAG: bifunctional 4-hydroxy-2-oxoglutarate aldolase/2-dehydro-3-deoxy-phosphogluconate aldolase [Pseudomonadota bacterium]